MPVAKKEKPQVTESEDKELSKVKSTFLSLFSDWMKQNFEGFIVGLATGIIFVGSALVWILMNME